jgi:hypothetical protein
MPRKYTKKSQYWSGPRTNLPAPIAPQSVQEIKQQEIDVMPETGMIESKGGGYMESTASCGGGNVNPNGARDGFTGSIVQLEKYPNIRSGLVPLTELQGNYTVSEAISTCYLAYHNFALLKNAINMLVDFSVSNIHIKTSNQKAKRFFKAWFDAINLNQFMSQFFMEYYRSGNVFIYKFTGKIDDTNFNMLKESYSAKSPLVPIRYILLNPMQVYLQRGASYSYGYVRMLSTYEIERLKNPQTTEDKQMFESFPTDIQNMIKQGGAWRYIFVPLDQSRLYYVFYRKQDYEPLAIPMAFPILNDIEIMLEMKRMDMALIKTMEQVILLVTSGRAADQYNQGTGVKHLSALSNIFQNQAIGRVLVADYTTKAQWLIPDVEELLGPKKYERVYQDIKEGLQYMFFGEEKFANASIKVSVFLQSLKEGRRAFLENFLIPEAKKICQAMNFKNLPEFEFEDVKINDEALMNKLYVQMAQLGLLTPEELNTALISNVLPDKTASIENQQEFKDQKDKGLYQPAIPNNGAQDGDSGGRPPGTKGPAPKAGKTPIGQSKTGNIKVGQSKAELEKEGVKHGFGATKIAENLIKANSLKDDVEKSFKKKYKIKELNEIQAKLSESLALSIIFNEKEESWKESIKAYSKEPKELNKDILKEMIDIAAEYKTDLWIAGILMRSKIDLKDIK